jgi:hypothetical protein
MKLYHRTTRENADLILREGFRNDEERYTSDFNDEGVWFSDQPEEGGECAFEEAVIAMDLALPAKSLSSFEWVEVDETAYREWLIPAELVNSQMTKVQVGGKSREVA